jgi:hypothetical protein
MVQNNKVSLLLEMPPPPKGIVGHARLDSLAMNLRRAVPGSGAGLPQAPTTFPENNCGQQLRQWHLLEAFATDRCFHFAFARSRQQRLKLRLRLRRWSFASTYFSTPQRV